MSAAPILRSSVGQTHWRVASLPWPFPVAPRLAVKAVGVAMVVMGSGVSESNAAISFSDPVRTLSSLNNKGSSHAETALGTDPFNQSVRVDWEEHWPSANTTGQYYSTASQESTISASGISAKGSVRGTGSFEFRGAQPLSQRSESSFAIDFTLDTSFTIFLTGVLDMMVDTGGTNYDLPVLWLTLTGQSGTVYSQNINAYNSPFGRHTQIDETFHSLEAGPYNLTVYAETVGSYSNFGIGGDGIASFDVVLIPEPSLCLIAGLGGILGLIRRVRCSG